MAKLHEVVAVEQQLKAQSATTRTDLMATFKSKRHLFEEKRVTFKSNEENVPEVVETRSDLQSTVKSELEWITGIWSKSLDASFTVARGNTGAKADITLDDGTVIVANVPATALLELDKRMNELQELIKAIPTLDPAKGFKPDEMQKNVYVAREITKTRTKKTQRPIVLYPATPEHPAQTQLVAEDVPTGTITELEWSRHDHSC